MSKYLFLFALLLAPVTALFVSCGITPGSVTSPTSNSVNTATTTPVITSTSTATSTPTPSVKTITTFASSVSIVGITVDSSDNVYLAGAQSGELIQVSSAGVSSNLLAQSSVNGVAFDGTNWYLDAASRVYLFNGTTSTAEINVGANALQGVVVNSSATTIYSVSNFTGISASVSMYSLPSYSAISTITLPAVPYGTNVLAVDNNGNVYVALSSLIIEYAAGTTSSPTTIAGTTSTTFANGAAASAGFSNITGIAVDKNGNVFIVDHGHTAVRELSNGQVTTLMGTSGQNAVITSPALSNPAGIAVDPAGNVFIADSQGPVYEYIP